ncbi:hypothetical protein PMAYCL1PPCAC_22570, partial [Pristionchus mayeri]
MKFDLLFLTLIGCGHCFVVIDVNIYGSLSCPTSFKSRVNVWEEDHKWHQCVGRWSDFADSESNPRADKRYHKDYKVSGEAYDGFWEWDVELFATYEHFCGGAHKCFCVDLGHHGWSFEKN